jgi:hypothetical protein
MKNIVSAKTISLGDEHTLIHQVFGPGHSESYNFGGGAPTDTDIAPGTPNTRWVDGEILTLNGQYTLEADIYYRPTNVYTLMLGRTIVAFENIFTGQASGSKELYNTASSDEKGISKYPINCIFTRDWPEGGESICFITERKLPYRFFTHKVPPGVPVSFNYAILASKYTEVMVYVAKGSVTKQDGTIVNYQQFTRHSGEEQYSANEESFLVVYYK